MTKKMLAVCTACTMLAGAVPAVPVQAVPAPAVLDVSGFVIRDENLVYIGADYLNAALVLFDDQDKVPISPRKTSVEKELWNATDRSKNWKPNWQAEYGDDTFYIDMGANYVITGLCFLDTNGVQDWKIFDGEPFTWQERGTFTTDAYNTWRGIEFEQPRATRYLRFTAPAGDSGVSELAIYGYKESELTDAQKQKTAAVGADGAKTKLTAGQKIGFNAFIDDPLTAIMAGGNVREYHNLSWLLDKDGKVKFTQGSWGDMDAYYGMLHSRGIDVIPCFQGNSSVIYGKDKPPEIACAEGADTEDPASYALHAQAMYQVAARYGNNKDVDPKALNVAEGSEPRTGLGYLTAAENSNEPNKTWSGKASYYTPYEMAALCSADYDGHEGTIENAGVKQADPDFKLAVGGLLNTASVLDYLSEMKLWFDYHRSDGRFAVDIINLHMGPDTFNPEDSGFTERVKAIREWINDNAPGCELWISEFEVPMGDCEQEGTDNHDNELYQLRYAQRVARTYLMALGSGVDRMTKFQLRDEGEGVYYNSGLTTGKGEWSKKQAWYYVSCMTHTLKNAYFAADMTQPGEEVNQYFFIDENTGDSILCLWSPTNEGKVVKGYRLQMPGNVYAYLTQPSEFAEGTMTELPAGMRSIALDIGETPVFVTLSAKPKTIVNGRGLYVKPKNIYMSEDGEVCDLSQSPTDSKLNEFYKMFDEPQSMPEKIYGDTAGLAAPETAVKASGQTCYVTLDQPYVFTGFGIYDTYGTGSIEIYDANTDTLLWSNDLGSYMCRNLEPTDDTAPTDKLKIVKGGGDMNELALYGYPTKQETAGDINADGECTLADVVLLQKYLLAQEKTLPDANAADLNIDGRLTTSDLSLLKQLLLG